MIIGNDVKVAARAEMAWGALRGVDDGLYLNLGTGIAAGIVADGRLLDGAHGAAGEVGYTLFGDRLGGDHLARDGVAPFEDWFGGAGAARRLDETELPGTVAEVVAREGVDPSAREFLSELWTGIVIGGGYVRGASGLLARMREVVERAVPFPPAIVTARFGADASLRGAAAVALAALESRS